MEEKVKIKEIHLEEFKRFTDLTIKDMPEEAKLVVLIGPNGCGKSSLFDAFKTWHRLNGYNNGTDNAYCKKNMEDPRESYQLVDVEFYKDISNISREKKRKYFYFRTAYRNSPTVTVRSLEKVNSPLETVDNKMMIENDSTVNDNYQRLIAETLSKVFDKGYDSVKVEELREELIGKIRKSIKNLFGDLELLEIGMPTDKPEFYFKKGTTEKYSYEKISGGEKAAFDLLLDLVVKSTFYGDTIFCIDEPEAHIHTKLQAALLKELYNLIPEDGQLWIATHSFGMLKEAKKLSEDNLNKVVFLNFDGYDFDDVVEMTPSGCDETIWNKMLEITLDEYASFLTPETIVFCEGTNKGHKRRDFDARCYSEIFRKKYPNVLFYSLGSCNDIEKEKNAIIEFASKLSPNTKIIRLIDRDDRSTEEIMDLEQNGIKVLKRRHIECYLLDDEVLEVWCSACGKEDEKREVFGIKQQCMADSIQRGNAEDDIKSASNDICTKIKKLFGLTKCGNNGETIMRDTVSKLFTEEMQVYKELEQEIFW